MVCGEAGEVNPVRSEQALGLAHWDCNQRAMGGMTWRLVMTGL